MCREIGVLVSTNTGTKEPYDKRQHGEGYSEDGLCARRVDTGAPCKAAPKTGCSLVPGMVDFAYFRLDNEDYFTWPRAVYRHWGLESMQIIHPSRRLGIQSD